MLLVLFAPQLQLLAHAVDVLLHVIHDLSQRVGASAQLLDGFAHLTNLSGRNAPLVEAQPKSRMQQSLTWLAQTSGPSGHRALRQPSGAWPATAAAALRAGS